MTPVHHHRIFQRLIMEKTSKEELPDTDPKVNTENNIPDCDENKPKQNVHKEDWSRFMFSSDDSLFEEWTRQMEEDDSAKQSPPKLAATNTTLRANTLPDIVLTKDKSDVVTGLLMLGNSRENIDKEVDNEELLFLSNTGKPMGDLLWQICRPAWNEARRMQHFTWLKMHHMMAMWVKGKFDGEQLKIILGNLEHSLRQNLSTCSHKHKPQATVYTQCIQQMMPRLPWRMNHQEI